MATPKRIVVNEQDGVSVVRFVDRKIVDSASIEQLGEELIALVTVDKRNMLLLNFENVEFLSSAALNKLISLRNKIKPTGGTLKLCNLHKDIEQVFKITKLDKLIEILPNEEKGLASFK
jgi:anti-sigma B factor antagonist